MNHITLSGNLTREPEVRTIPNSEYSVIAFGLANNDQRKKMDTGAFESIANFFDCEYFTKNPQHWLAQLRKGIGVVVEGELLQDRWEKDGQNYSKVVVIVNQIDLLGGPERQDGYQQGPQRQRPPQAQQSGPESFVGDGFDDEQIPF